MGEAAGILVDVLVSRDVDGLICKELYFFMLRRVVRFCRRSRFACHLCKVWQLIRPLRGVSALLVCVREYSPVTE
jgi:hypothetical protein